MAKIQIWSVTCEICSLKLIIQFKSDSRTDKPRATIASARGAECVGRKNWIVQNAKWEGGKEVGGKVREGMRQERCKGESGNDWGTRKDRRTQENRDKARWGKCEEIKWGNKKRGRQKEYVCVRWRGWRARGSKRSNERTKGRWKLERKSVG